VPKAYRSFNRKDATLAPGDDYGMMRHVLTRRLGALLKGGEDTEKQWPDLLLIDGGAGQLSAAQDVFADLGITIPCVAIANGVERNAGREWFFMPDKEPFQLPPQDPVLHYLQRLRDEAHRFAIGIHRKKRSKSMTQSSLDTIPGIGGARKKALLHHFGSGKAVETATLHELEKVEGISSKTAKVIYEHFRG
jgi:excinuclease ABC subunit C